MRKDVKEKWVAALRSGEYEQGDSALCRRGEDGIDRYCCLGVLCEIAVQHGVLNRYDPAGEDNNFEYGIEGNVSFLPEAVMNWVGIDSIDPFVKHEYGGGRVRTTLAECNDELGFDFNKIGDLIEEQL